MFTKLAIDTLAAEEMLCTWVNNMIVLLDGALTIQNEANRSTVSSLRGVRLNMAMLPREMLYLLQDGVTIKLKARESHALQVMSEQHINIEQLGLLCNEAIEKNKKIMQVVEEAYQMVLELAIQGEELVEVLVCKFSIGVHETQVEKAKVRLDQNLQIVELQLKAQPSTLLQIREQCTTSVTIEMVTVDSVVEDYMQIFE